MKSKEKIIKLILVILLICIVIFVLNVVRKAIIIRSISKEYKENYASITNFYEKIKDEYFVTEIWRKDNRAIIKKTYENENNTDKDIEITFIDENYKYIIKDDKVTKLNKEESDLPILKNAIFDVPNFSQALYASLMYDVSSEKVYGEDCYYIECDTTSLLYNMINFRKDNITAQSFVNKDTKLVYKEISNTGVRYYKYELNNVTDENVNMPDIEDLELVDETK